MFNSIIKGHYAAESPGEHLLAMLVQHSCARGLDTFDLGIGQANHKALFCEDAEPLFDSYVLLGASGRLFSFAFGTIAAVKRVVKQHAALWSLVRATPSARASGRRDLIK